MERKYNIPQIRASATKCDEVGKEVKFNASSMLELNKDNAGEVKKKVDEIIQEMSACAADTQAYFINSAKFIRSVAEHFEKMDEDLAKKVKES